MAFCQRGSPGINSPGNGLNGGCIEPREGFWLTLTVYGVANILRKSKHDALSGLSRGCLAQPLRVKIS